MLDNILFDKIYYPVIYALIFWVVGLFIPSLVLSYSSSRVSLVLTPHTKLSESKTIRKSIFGLQSNIKSSEMENVKPFHVVLIDIEKAAYENTIHCIETPLQDNPNLAFVALSYRWGEVEETLVDTHLDYLASITSFSLAHFYRLCKYIKQEPDLQSMKYVWVDAICVDQANPERRKATIYQMTNIYNRANYILAVPDLNLQYLIDVSKNNDTISMKTKSHSAYLYHLINGDKDTLAQLEETWLDINNVPKDEELRKTLASTVDNFVDGLMEYNIHDPNYCPEDAFLHIQHATFEYRKGNAFTWKRPIRNVHTWKPLFFHTTSRENSTTATTPSVFNYPYHVLQQKNNRLQFDQSSPTSMNDVIVQNKPSVPFDWLHLTLAEVKNDEWKNLITKRNDQIKKSLLLLVDLIKDWSTRAWVVSEYSIASKKNSGKMKYWFVQLDDPDLLGLPFFEFDFFATMTPQIPMSQHHPLTRQVASYGQNVCTTMAEQLQKKTFVEKMLLSKASKNEDRFSAIFPGVDGYKNMVQTKDTVRGWQITNLLSVKLKLYEIMTTEDKLELLFLSGPEKYKTPVLPTFAATDVDKSLYKRKFLDSGMVTNPLNFNLNDEQHHQHSASSAITLIKPTDSATGLWRLHIKPTMYYILGKDAPHTAVCNMDTICDVTRTLWSRLDIQVNEDILVPICIPMTENGMIGESAYNLTENGGAFILLIGSFEKNKWIVFRYLDCPLTCVTLKAGSWSIHYEKFEFDIF